MKLLSIGCVCAAICLVSSAMPMRAQAQADHPKLDAKACADRERLALGDSHQLLSKETDGSNPSEKLARTDGVICPPPDLDPDIRAPAPGGGRTPVIPPASVQPGTRAK
jgi:hypothetical protein